jgi:hypothetical protein
MGHPGETEATADATVEFLNTLNYDGEGTFEFLFAPFFLIPLSPIYEPAARQAFELCGYMGTWSHRSLSSDDIPRLMRKAFLGISDQVFYTYVDDDVLPPLPANMVRRVKVLRQRARKLQLEAELEGRPPSDEFGTLLHQLRGEFTPYL